jgi:hypothetical protein
MPSKINFCCLFSVLENKKGASISKIEAPSLFTKVIIAQSEIIFNSFSQKNLLFFIFVQSVLTKSKYILSFSESYVRTRTTLE